MTQAEVIRVEMGWRACGGESACGNKGHRPVYCTLPALPTNTHSTSFFPFQFSCLIWQLLSDLLSAGNCRSQQRGSVPTPFTGANCHLHRLGGLQPLYCWSLCKNSTSSHLPPSQNTGEPWWPGNSDYFISLGLSQVLRQCTGLHCPGCVTNLSVSSLFFIEMSPVQVTAIIPRKSRLGLLTSALICSQNQEDCSRIPAQPASRGIMPGKPCHLSFFLWETRQVCLPHQVGMTS